MGTWADGTFQREPFFIEFSNVFLHGDILRSSRGDDRPPALLLLHDLYPQVDRTQYNLLRLGLINYHHVTSCAFDFIGHGSTGGDWEDSSFNLSRRQALDVIDACFDCQPLSIVASGLSAYTAIQLLSVAPVDNLILLSPMIPFPDIAGVSFSQALHEQSLCLPRSWGSTNIAEVIRCFEGWVSVIVTNHEQQISAGFASELERLAVLCSAFRITELAYSGDAEYSDVMSLVDAKPAVLTQVVSEIASVCPGRCEEDAEAETVSEASAWGLGK